VHDAFVEPVRVPLAAAAAVKPWVIDETRRGKLI
jgi:hypothetical protein